jgi:hypothetical protein
MVFFFLNGIETPKLMINNNSLKALNVSFKNLKKLVSIGVTK